MIWFRGRKNCQRISENRRIKRSRESGFSLTRYLLWCVYDELIDTNDCKEHKAEIDEQVSLIDRAIAQYEIDKAKREKKVFDLEAIKERLNTFIDLKGYKVNEEMIDMFVERIIYRGIVNENDEFLWVMNLSGEVTDTFAKYKIQGYDKAYSDSLKDDKNFNIVARMMIPMEECKRYCEEDAYCEAKRPSLRSKTAAFRF